MQNNYRIRRADEEEEQQKQQEHKQKPKNILADLRAFVLELCEKEGQEMFDGVLFAEDGRQSHDDGRQSWLDVLIGVVDQLLDAGQTVIHDQPLPIGRIQRLTKLLHLRHKKSKWNNEKCYKIGCHFVFLSPPFNINFPYNRTSYHVIETLKIDQKQQRLKWMKFITII